MVGPLWELCQQSEAYRALWDELFGDLPADKPSLPRRFLTITLAMLAHARNWFQEVPRAIYLQRLAVCKGTGRGTAVNGVWTAQPCPHYWERSKQYAPESWHRRLWRRVLLLVLREEDTDKRCNLCGCCGLKLKLPASECPIGKWPKHSP